MNYLKIDLNSNTNDFSSLNILKLKWILFLAEAKEELSEQRKRNHYNGK